MKINREYKSSVFAALFGGGKEALGLYGAIEGRTFPDGTEVIVNTLTDALFKGRINDVSFVVDGRLVVLIEHQSTVNGNMPLRALLYIAKLYEKMSGNMDIYSGTPIRIPTPEFIVLYNGAAEYPDRSVLRLSDAFAERGARPELELTVKVFNINKGRNTGFSDRCKTLGDYVFFVARIRENIAGGLDPEQAVAESVRFCIAEGILKEFLEANKGEVEGMLFTEWNWDHALQVSHMEGVEKGIEQGIEQGIEKSTQVINLHLKGLPPDAIASRLNLPIGEVGKIIAAYMKLSDG